MDDNATYSPITSALNLGLVQTDYNYLMALSGSFIGVIFCFFLLTAIFQISKHRT